MILQKCVSDVCLFFIKATTTGSMVFDGTKSAATTLVSGTASVTGSVLTGTAAVTGSVLTGTAAVTGSVLSGNMDTLKGWRQVSVVLFEQKELPLLTFKYFSQF